VSCSIPGRPLHQRLRSWFCNGASSRTLRRFWLSLAVVAGVSPAFSPGLEPLPLRRIDVRQSTRLPVKSYFDTEKSFILTFENQNLLPGNNRDDLRDRQRLSAKFSFATWIAIVLATSKIHLRYAPRSHLRQTRQMSEVRDGVGAEARAAEKTNARH